MEKCVSWVWTWEPGEPSSSDEDCVELIGDDRGEWNGQECDESRYYVCQFRMLKSFPKKKQLVFSYFSSCKKENIQIIRWK